MRILILTQYYPPEIGAAQNRLSDLARRLTAAGHRVTVLTAMPNYPQGEIYSGYRGRFAKKETDEGIGILRTWVYTTKEKSFLPRIINYISFAFFALVLGCAAAEDADIVLTESPPLFVAGSGYLLSKAKRAKFVLNVSDLWPESAVALGILHNRSLISLARRLEEWLYDRAVVVAGQTQGIVDSISRRCNGKRVLLMTNGVSPEFLASAQTAVASRESVRQEFGVKGKFVVGFPGLHGLVYRLDLMLEAARNLAKQEDIHFILLGDGPEKGRLQEKAKLERIDNVTFAGTLPAARMPNVLAAMDVMVIPLRRHDLFKGTLPSKLFEGMGAGVPIVGALEGEARQVIEAAQCGICVEPENSAAMADAILSLYRDPELRRRLGENGRRYVAKHYNRKEIAAQFEQVLVEVCGSARSASEAPEKSQLTELPNNDAVFTGQTRE